MKKPTPKQLRDQEVRLVAKLQKEHGWMFFEWKRKDERHTMLFRRTADGKHTLTPGRRVGIVFPSTSPLAIAFDKAAKDKARRARSKERP